MIIRTLSDYCKEKFGTKVYRLSLSTGCSCPNRDGRAGRGGCSFCSEGGSGEFATKVKPVEVQIEEAKDRVKSKFPKDIKEEDKKYIAYFQSFTNTYGDVDRLGGIFRTAVLRDEIAAISIGTRPDCLEGDMLALLDELNKIKPVWIELGLQTIHEDSAKAFNRGYSLPVFNKAYMELKKRNIEVIVHVILGLPGETDKDMYETVRYLANLSPKLDGIKLHLLHILKNTRLEREYREKPFKILSLDEYTEILINCLRILPESVVIHRMTGDGDKRLLVEPLWSADKKKVLNTINKAIREAKR
ncbi:MAG: TIGR01212 family radical SAM protein [Lachnospiraceae bacterium]|nr:TIGR01212 family radical SAM protein [Lachnospiraceae bacterium]